MKRVKLLLCVTVFCTARCGKFLRHGFFRRKFLVFAEKNFGPKTRREEKQLDTQCTPLYLVFPPGALPGGHTHRSCGIPCGAQMRDCSLFQAQISVLVMHVERDSQPLFLLLFFSYFVPQNFFRRKLKFLGEKTYVAKKKGKKRLEIQKYEYKKYACEIHAKRVWIRRSDGTLTISLEGERTFDY